jgi:hypothetical protein
MTISIIPNVAPEELVRESIYFMLTFFDGNLLIPDVVTVVYLGQDIFEEGDEFHYFEDFRQYSDLKKVSVAYDEQQIIRADQKLRNFYTASGVAEVFAFLANAKKA